MPDLAARWISIDMTLAVHLSSSVCDTVLRRSHKCLFVTLERCAHERLFGVA